MKEIDAQIFDYCQEGVRAPMFDFGQAIQKLDAVKGGMSDEDVRYTDELAPDADYEAVFARAEATIFSTKSKGLTKKLWELIAACNKAHTALKEAAERFWYDLGEDKFYFHKLELGIEAVVGAQTTMAEAKIMHNISRDKKTALSQRQTHVSEEVAKTQPQEGETPLPIHGAIKAKAHEFVRT